MYPAHDVRSSVRNVFFRTYLFQNSLMTTAHFIIGYLICLFSIFISSSVTLVDIQTDIMKTCLILDMHMSRIPNLSNYSLNFENQCLVFICKMLNFSTIDFGLIESYIHFFYCYGSYFNFIGYIVFQFFL